MPYAIYENTTGIVVGWYDLSYPDLPTGKAAIEVTSEQYAARLTNPSGWQIKNGAPAEYTPPAPVLTVSQHAAVAVAAGLTITSTSSPTLNGIYAVDSTAQNHIFAEVASIMLDGTFADGGTTVSWLDATGNPHTFTIAQFKTLASAIAAYVANLTKCMIGQVATLPSGVANIP